MLKLNRVFYITSKKVAFYSSATSVTLSNGNVTNNHIKSWKELPGPKGHPIIGNALFYLKDLSKLSYFHEIQVYHHNKYGNMYREQLGPKPSVHISDPILIETVHRNETKYPTRISLTQWKLYREIYNEAYALLTSEEEDWFRVRLILNKRLLTPKLVADHDKKFNEVVNDLIIRMKLVMETKGGGKIVPNLANEFYKWSMESICYVLFETRMGCLKEPIPPNVQKFINAVGQMFKTTNYMFIFPHMQKLLNLKPWRDHVAAWDVLFSVAKSYINTRLLHLEQELNKNGLKEQPQQVEFLTYLLSNSSLSMKEIYANVTELMLAGTDTTSTTLSFLIYELAKNYKIQKRLYDEIKSIIGERHPTAPDIEQMSYLNAAVRETLRMYPVLFANTRTLKEKMVLGGYHLPKGMYISFSYFAMSKNQEVFPEPEVFKPERWLKNSKAAIHPYASVPFGAGIRSCVGQRIAKLEIRIAIIRILQEYELTLHGDGILKPIIRGVLSPDRDIPVEFIKRQIKS